MEEIVFKKTDINGDGYISEEDRKTSESRLMDYAQKQNTDKKVLEANKAVTETYTAPLAQDLTESAEKIG
jgi:hypothetical protein